MAGEQPLPASSWQKTHMIEGSLLLLHQNVFPSGNIAPCHAKNSGNEIRPSLSTSASFQYLKSLASEISVASLTFSMEYNALRNSNHSMCPLRSVS
mmetsp:Transcript_62810/g.147324  ORF Transcript_62810/g.147324 Transcript_62810/m.147324 type:complete len:96 (-) Transcript_62810:869-1156(-)